MTGMVDIEMGADEDIDIAGLQTQISQLRYDVLAILRLRHLRTTLKSLWHTRRQSTIYKHIFAILGLNQVAGNRGGQNHLEQVQALRSRDSICHSLLLHKREAGINS